MERQRDGISPTPVGEMLLEYCERRGALDEGFIASLESYQRMETGKISLTVGEGFVSDLVASPCTNLLSAMRASSSISIRPAPRALLTPL
ncbi:hypothetical protein P4544_01700 [Halomonas sp. LY9]